MFVLWVSLLVLMVLGTSENRAGLEKVDKALQEAPAVLPQGEGTRTASLVIEARAAPVSLVGLDPMTNDGADQPRCQDERPGPGAAIAAPNDPHLPEVYALLSADMENAFLPLLRNCSRIDVLLPDAFEFSPSLGVTPVNVDAEMQEALGAVQAEMAAQIRIWPIFSLKNVDAVEGFLARLEDKETAIGLAEVVLSSAKAARAQGACLRLGGIQAADAPRLAVFLDALSKGARESDLALCLVASLSDQQWSDPDFTAPFDRVIVSVFQEPWIGSYPQPLAPLDWFERQVNAIKSRMPVEKLVVALGGHAVDWVSGKAIPERISMAEAMFRISQARASIDFSQTARNSHSAFFDQQGNRHQIWMLDAASLRNSVLKLHDLGIGAIAVPSLGEEEPAYWEALDRGLSLDAIPIFATPAYPDNVIYTGEGAFYRLASAASPGRRMWRQDKETGLVVDQQYQAVPRPAHMERYGLRNPRQIALTFDDGPNPVATSQILDALKAEGVPATFFVVGTAALAAPELLQRALQEGHIIGSHSFSHPHMEELSEFMLRTELSANRSLIEGVTGRTPVLYRPPYTRGPGPLSKDEAEVFVAPNDEGHIVVGSDVVPADWQGISADEIVRQVLHELETGGGNVIVLHDGRSTGMHTAEAVRILVPELRARGYEIVPVAELLRLTTDAVMPRIDVPASLFKGLSVFFITLFILMLTQIFWLCVFAGLLRSVIYLLLSARRDPTFPRSFAPSPKVAVVVPAYNEEKVIVATVRSVLACRYQDLRCIVVDDGSTDETLERLHEAFGGDPRVHILHQANAGKWQALNLAFENIEAEIAVCVDADTRVAQDAIAELVKPFADRKVAAVAGTVVVANEINLLTRFQSVEYINAQQIGRRAHEHLNGILVVPGALGAWRVEAVREVGLFSNETMTEDADLTILLRRAGYRIAYAEKAKSFTEAPSDVRSLMKQRLRWSLGNLQTLWKHRDALWELDLRRALSLLDMIFFGYVLPVLSPILDLMFLYFLTNVCLDWFSGKVAGELEVSHLALIFVLVLQAVDILSAYVAHRRQGVAVGGLIYQVPLMNLLYRPLLYITVYRALWAAFSGRLARWNKLRRHGLEARLEKVAG